MYLPLAERMAEKYASTNKIEAEAEVNLYLMILEMLGKHGTALDVIQGTLGGKYSCLVNSPICDLFDFRTETRFPKYFVFLDWLQKVDTCTF